MPARPCTLDLPHANGGVDWKAWAKLKPKAAKDLVAPFNDLVDREALALMYVAMRAKFLNRATFAI